MTVGRTPVSEPTEWQKDRYGPHRQTTAPATLYMAGCLPVDH